MKRELEKILNFQKARDWKQFHTPKNLAISLVLESSEVLEVFQWDEKLNKQKEEQLADEISDVYYYLLLLAHEAGIDLKEAFNNKMKKNEIKYPVEKVKGSSRKYDEYND